MAEPWLLFAMAITILLLDSINQYVREGPISVPVIWPGNGVLLGVALVVRRRHLASVILVGFASMALRTGLSGQPLANVMLISCAKVSSICVAAVLLRRKLGPGRDLTRHGMLFYAAVMAIVVMPLPPSLLVAVLRGASDWNDTGAIFFSSYLANALGVVVATPVVLALYREELREQFAPSRLGRTLLMFTLLAICTSGIFLQTSLPLLYLTFPPLLWLVSRQGFAGATLAILVISVITSVLTIRGLGPIQLVATTYAVQTMTLQIYLLTVAGTAFCMGVLIAGRRRLDLEINVRETRARFAEAKMRRSETMYRHLSENASDIVSRLDLCGRRMYISRSAEEVLGWTPQELLGDQWLTHVHPDDRDQFLASFPDSVRPMEQISSIYRVGRRDGSWAWIDARARLIRDSRGEPLEYISNARDITNQKKTEQALAEAMSELSVLATTDGLTGLANRRRFDETLRREWRRAMRSGEPVGLLMVDVDHFKLFNDHYGHHEGDQCLRQIAATIAASVRRPGDLAARFGGEEFAVILPGATDSGTREMANRLVNAIEALARPHAASLHGLVTTSIGCAAIVPARQSVTTQLVQAADAALYAAKRAGRNRVAAFTDLDSEVADAPVKADEPLETGSLHPRSRREHLDVAGPPVKFFVL